MKYARAYISGALTNVDPKLGLRGIYESLGALCDSIGIKGYVPHLKGDPILFPTISAKDIWKMDSEAVTAADVTIAYVGVPALGVGQELEIARVAGKDLILWWFAGERVTRMTLGNPAVVAQFEVRDVEELHNKLRTFLNFPSSVSES